MIRKLLFAYKMVELNLIITLFYKDVANLCELNSDDQI